MNRKNNNNINKDNNKSIHTILLVILHWLVKERKERTTTTITNITTKVYREYCWWFFIDLYSFIFSLSIVDLQPSTYYLWFLNIDFWLATFDDWFWIFNLSFWFSHMNFCGDMLSLQTTSRIVVDGLKYYKLLWFISWMLARIVVFLCNILVSYLDASNIVLDVQQGPKSCYICTKNHYFQQDMK